MGLQTDRWHKSIGLYIILHCCYRVKHSKWTGNRLVLCVCSTHLIWSTSRTKLATQKQVDCIRCRMEVVPFIELNVFHIHVVITYIFWIFSHVKFPQWRFDNKVFSSRWMWLPLESGVYETSKWMRSNKKIFWYRFIRVRGNLFIHFNKHKCPLF